VVRNAAGQTLNTDMYKEVNFVTLFPTPKFIQIFSKRDYNMKKLDTLNEELSFKV
jgi:hypothetical protein